MVSPNQFSFKQKSLHQSNFYLAKHSIINPDSISNYCGENVRGKCRNGLSVGKCHVSDAYTLTSDSVASPKMS